MATTTVSSSVEIEDADAALGLSPASVKKIGTFF